MSSSRRLLLRRASQAGTVLLLPGPFLSLLPACRDREDPGPNTDDSGGNGEIVPPVTLSKEPWVSLLGPGSARLRLETREEQPVAITLRIGSEGEPSEVEPILSAVTLTYSWASGVEIEGVLPDDPGLHVLQDVVMEGLPAGSLVTWSVDLGGGQSRSGTFRADPGPGAEFRLGWIADTMHPTSADVLALLAAEAPDILLHGGDIQYQSNPIDTWQGFFDAASPAAALAPLMLCVGNHEDEDQDELAVMYERLVGGQGDGTAGSSRYFGFRYGGVRFLCLDSESGDLADPDSAQRQWLAAELAATEADSSLRYAVICMHRPVYTLSKHWPSDTTVRDALHALCVQYGVPLVLAGHAHCYEHFEVDGVHYVVDGGGGALLYDPDEEIEAAEAARPGEPALRLAASRSHGVTLLHFAADGTISLRRAGLDGGDADVFTIG